MIGGSIYVDIEGKLIIKNASFENTPNHSHTRQGDILYSDGQLYVDDVKLFVRTAINGLSILRHSGQHWSLAITNVWVQCPVGYDLRAVNSSAYGVAMDGLQRSFKLDQLSYFCESCPRNKYSLEFGYLNSTYDDSSGTRPFAFFTLLVNSSEPSMAFTDKNVYHKVLCQDCPYGGHCVENISAVANFWGFASGDGDVVFQHCPRGYCCSERVCPAIDSCSSHRTGTLCGRCRSGYSEALFSSSCIANEKCNITAVLWFGAVVGLLYAAVLLIKMDVQTFLFDKPLGLSGCVTRICKRYNSKEPTATRHLNGDVKPNGTSTLARAEHVKFLPNGSDVTSNVTDAHVHTDENNCHISLHGSTLLETVPADADDDATDVNVADDKAFGSGFLVIMFYYFQDALLLNVETVFIEEESRREELIKTLLSGIFKFQLDLFVLWEEGCVWGGMTPVPNLLAKAMIVPYVLALFIVTYVFSAIKDIFCAAATLPASAHDKNNSHRKRMTFKTRLASGFILALLFMFQKLGTTTFTLLNCVQVNDKKVLYIDGEIECYAFWQYFVMAYAAFCVAPFCVVLLWGTQLLQQGRIPLIVFFLSLLFPPPFIVYLLCRGFRHISKPAESRRAPTAASELSDCTEAVVSILQGPFKPMRWCCWSGVMIARRLGLVLLFTFMTDSLLRLLCMLFACFIILLTHVHVKPYKDWRGDFAGTLSAAGLVILASVNLVRAGFEAAEYTPSGPNTALMWGFTQVENALLLWAPLAILIIILVVLIVRVAVVIYDCIKKCICKADYRSDVIAKSEGT